jgi:GT2 family glycosyltransferase
VAEVADASVVVRTVGRPVLLEKALRSIADCDPPPAEVLVVDQSEERSGAAVIDRVAFPGARHIPSRGRGRGLAMNEGFENAEHEVVLVVDDDCTVRADWVEAAMEAMRETPDGILTGQVLPAAEDARAVPSTIELDEPRDYTGEIHFGVLFSGNMAAPRDAVLSLGGFDEIIGPFATDCDFCYRWLTAGRQLRHVPELVVWHHDWRSASDLRQLYVDYARSRGMFYAKHLRAGDTRMIRYIARDYYGGFRSLYSGLVRGVPRWADDRRGVFAGLHRGLRAGWRRFGSSQPRGTRRPGSGPALP